MQLKNKTFILIEALLYLTFIVMDIIGIDSTYIKYAGIILCFLNALFDNKKLITAALLFTLIADYFLLVRDNDYLFGIISFLVVQCIYFVYLKKNNCKPYFIIRILLYVITIIGSLVIKAPILDMLALCYFESLLMNTISSYTNKKLRVFSIGLSLFIGCDICVGLFNILPHNNLYSFVSIMMWIFYLPSQVLISLSKDEN